MKLLLIFPLFVALASAESNPEASPEAKPDAVADPGADSDANNPAAPPVKRTASPDLGPHGHGGHVVPHHPIDPHHVVPAPHHPEPHHPHPDPHHHKPAPAYSAPAPPPYGHHEPAPYTPAAPYHPPPHHAHPHGPPHHGPPHHGLPHHGPPHHGAPHHGPYAPHHPDPYHQPVPYGPPKCAIGNPKTFCLDDAEYPAYEISAAIEYNYDAVQQMYKDVLASTENSVDGLVHLEDEQYLCPTESGYVQPLRALNAYGKWRIIVNHVKAHYETLSQTARVEECLDSGEACPLIPHGPRHYESKCVQKFTYQRMLVYDPYDKYLPFAVETFKLPTSCACHVGEYIWVDTP